MEPQGGVTPQTITSILAYRAAGDPAAPYLRTDDAVLSFGEVDDQAEALAASFANLGIGPGDRIALVLPAWPEFAISVFAAARIGALVVPVDPRLRLPELRYALRHSGVVCAVSAENAYGIDFLQIFEDFLVELPALSHLVTVGKEDLWYDDRIFQWEDLLSAGVGRDFAAPAAAPEDPFAILYTPGTSGKPRGVELTHANLLHAATETTRAIGLAPGDVVAGVSALHHVFGLGPGLLGTALSGAALVLRGDADAADSLNAAERHGATVQYGVPTDFATLLRQIDGSGGIPPTLRLCLSSGAPMTDDLARRIEASLGVPLVIAYSLTEVASTLAMSRPGDRAEKRLFTVGRPIGGTEVRVKERDGTTLPPESVGEIAVRGPGLMRGYYRQPLETAAATDPDGYLRTGDLGLVDEDGYLHLVGRREDVVIRSGFKVHPREVEDRIMAHPAVDRAAVVGVPDEILGEAICACVVRVEGGVATEQEIRAWSAVTLAGYKVPDLVSFMDELPLTDTGTVRRRELARRVSATPLDAPAESRQATIED